MPEPRLNDILQNFNKKEAVKYDLFFVMALSCHGSIYNSCGDISRYS